MDEPPPYPEIDRLLPQNLDAERAVLGGILIDAGALAEVPFLRPESFYRQGHRLIFAAMRALSERGVPPDVVLVADELGGDLEAAGGAGFLSGLGLDCPTSVYTAQYGRIVERTATLRRLIQAAGRIAAIGYEDGDPAEARERAEAELLAVWP